ncbi:MAG: hypothetical protein P8N02_17915 [Actinomycetota bacterium]|nr:hypothetical protein [Actinomycetota bacterium]
MGPASSFEEIDHPGARPAFTVPAGSPIEAFYDEGLTDGLPVVPPTPDRVEAMLAGGPWAQDVVLLHEKTRGIDVTAHLAAVNAVMAGARPEFFPVIGTVLDAMGDPGFFLHGPTTSTGGATIMIIVSGPVAEAIGVQSRENLFGPGFRANATIGRAIRLIQMNCLAAIPGQLDKSTQGWPGKFSLCFAEDVASSPWEPLHVRRGHRAEQSTVTIFASESAHNIVNHAAADAEPLLMTFADAMAALGSFSPGRSVVVFAPEHARKIGASGWRAVQVQEFLYSHARRTLASLKRTGKIEDDPVADTDWTGRWKPSGDPVIHPGDEDIWVHRGWSPDDILVLVGGGAAGGHSAFFPSWSRGRSVQFVTREVAHR